MQGNYDIKIWYLFHSGFAVRAGERLLIFDYWKTKPLPGHTGLDGGVIEPEEVKDLDVTVFASHAHADHYNPDILEWERTLPRARCILSYDIEPVRTADNQVKAYPNETYDFGGMIVRTLRSTDEGVAFIVEADGVKIYHAGDLNWWHWAGEPDGDNKAMARAYREQIGLISGERFDLAFVPVDPRLEGQYLWGLDYFMRHTDTKAVFPMHFGTHTDVFDRLYADPMSEPYRERVRRITRRGEQFEYKK